MTLLNVKTAGYLDSIGSSKYRLNAAGHDLVTHKLRGGKAPSPPADAPRKESKEVISKEDGQGVIDRAPQEWRDFLRRAQSVHAFRGEYRHDVKHRLLALAAILGLIVHGTHSRRTKILGKALAVGTGQALDIGRRGDGDAVFARDRPAEEKFMADRFGVRRFDVM